MMAVSAVVNHVGTCANAIVKGGGKVRARPNLHHPRAHS